MMSPALVWSSTRTVAGAGAGGWAEAGAPRQSRARRTDRRKHGHAALPSRRRSAARRRADRWPARRHGRRGTRSGCAAAGCRRDRGSRGFRTARPARRAACGTAARASGARRRITSMQTATAMKAVSVPALASAASSASGIRPASTATTIAVKMVIRTGEPRPETRASAVRQQPVARHHEEDPALAVEEGEDDRRQRDHRRDGEILGGPVGWPISRRIRASGSGLLAKRLIGERADRGCRRPPCR